MAATAVDKLLNFYPPLDVNDPKAFIAGLVALLAQYPAELMEFAIDPARGIPSHLKSLHSLAAIKEVCDDLYEPIARRLHREALANAPRQLPPPPRTAEEQAKIDEQVEAVLNERKARVEPDDPQRPSRVQAWLAERKKAQQA